MYINNWSEKWSGNMQKAHKVMKKSDYIKKLAYNNAYNRQNYKSFSIRLNRESESEMIDWLNDMPSVKEYLVHLIQKDMEREAKKKNKKKASSKD